MIAKEQWIVTGVNLSWDNWTGLNETPTTQTLYSLEEVFVQDRLLWKNAQSENWEILNWGNFKYAEVKTSELWQPVVSITFDSKWGNIFCSVTTNNVGKQMAIFIWWELITSPVIQSKICDGSAQIDGNFTAESAKELANQLNDWALPAPLILMQEEKIKYNLWASSLVKLNNFFTFWYLSNLLEQ
jgi:preprotein translocase subunit SecD